MRSPEDASSALRDVIGLSRSLDDYATTQLNWPGSIVYAHHRGLEVGCLLMDRLAALGRRYGAQVLVVSYPEHPMLAAKDMSVKERLQAWAFGKHIRLTPRREEHLTDRLVSCARDRHLQELDLFPAFAQLDPRSSAPCSTATSRSRAIASSPPRSRATSTTIRSRSERTVSPARRSPPRVGRPLHHRHNGPST